MCVCVWAFADINKLYWLLKVERFLTNNTTQLGRLPPFLYFTLYESCDFIDVADLRELLICISLIYINSLIYVFLDVNLFCRITLHLSESSNY